MTKRQRGLSLLEILIVITIMGVLASMVTARFGGHVSNAKKTSCDTNRGHIEVQIQLWRRHHGSLPATDLSDIGADAAYFPDGVPTCPVDGTPYSMNPTTGKIIAHVH